MSVSDFTKKIKRDKSIGKNDTISFKNTQLGLASGEK